MCHVGISFVSDALLQLQISCCHASECTGGARLCMSAAPIVDVLTTDAMHCRANIAIVQKGRLAEARLSTPQSCAQTRSTTAG